MFVTVRGVSDWLWAKPLCLAAVLVIGNWQPIYGQGKDETPQQTNQKIEQLATLARAHPVDIPIGSGDLLHVDVFDVPELSRDVRVSDAGDISYPLIPARILAAGLTPFQLEQKLDQLLIENGLVAHPQVSVFVKEQNSQPVSVVGAVNHTMIYQVTRPTTLLEVLSAAGGIADNAGGSCDRHSAKFAQEAPKVEPTSATNDPAKDEQKITIRIQDLLESGNAVYNIPVYGGDTISVPPGWNRVCDGIRRGAAGGVCPAEPRGTGDCSKSNRPRSWLNYVCESRFCCDHADKRGDGREGSDTRSRKANRKSQVRMMCR